MYIVVLFQQVHLKLSDFTLHFQNALCSEVSTAFDVKLLVSIQTVGNDTMQCI